MGVDLVKGVGTTWNIHEKEEPLVRLIAMSMLIGTLLIGGYNFYANSTYYNPINKRQVEGGFVPQLQDNAAILQLLFTGQYEDPLYQYLLGRNTVLFGQLIRPCGMIGCTIHRIPENLLHNQI